MEKIKEDTTPPTNVTGPLVVGTGQDIPTWIPKKLRDLVPVLKRKMLDVKLKDIQKK